MTEEVMYTFLVTKAAGVCKHPLTESTSTESPEACWEFWDQLEGSWWSEHLVLFFCKRFSLAVPTRVCRVQHATLLLRTGMFM